MNREDGERRAFTPTQRREIGLYRAGGPQAVRQDRCVRAWVAGGPDAVKREQAKTEEGWGDRAEIEFLGECDPADARRAGVEAWRKFHQRPRSSQQVGPSVPRTLSVPLPRMSRPRSSRRSHTAATQRKRQQPAGGDEPPGELPLGVLAGLADEVAFSFDPPSLTLASFADALVERGVPMGHLHHDVFLLLPELHQDAAWTAAKAESDARWAIESERAV